MANIRIDTDHTLKDGLELVFRAPCDASAVTGMLVYSTVTDTTQEFKLTDANGNDLGSINHLFAGSAVVKVILDVTQGKAFVQNADTNKYLEDRFANLIVIGDTEPENGPVLWFNTSAVSPSAQQTVMLALEEETEAASVIAEIDGEDYSVANIGATTSTSAPYDFTII